MKRRKRVFTAFALLSCIGMSALSILASDDNIPIKDINGYEFNIKTQKQNTHSQPRLRQTTHTNNPWKVNVQKSGEGKGTVTNFWLETKKAGVPESEWPNVSPTRAAKAGNGSYYTDAYSSANNVTVYLTGENNNKNNAVYIVEGYWDEETWK